MPISTGGMPLRVSQPDMGQGVFHSGQHSANVAATGPEANLTGIFKSPAFQGENSRSSYGT
jgi:hypothetical protein